MFDCLIFELCPFLSQVRPCPLHNAPKDQLPTNRPIVKQNQATVMLSLVIRNRQMNAVEAYEHSPASFRDDIFFNDTSVSFQPRALSLSA
jgi:hypothetical protein